MNPCLLESTSQDAAAVRADHPIPPQAGVYYFEVQVISNGQKGYIGIGFSSRAVDLERLPGERGDLHPKVEGEDIGTNMGL